MNEKGEKQCQKTVPKIENAKKLLAKIILWQ